MNLFRSEFRGPVRRDRYGKRRLVFMLFSRAVRRDTTRKDHSRTVYVFGPRTDIVSARKVRGKILIRLVSRFTMNRGKIHNKFGFRRKVRVEEGMADIKLDTLHSPVLLVHLQVFGP